LWARGVGGGLGEGRKDEGQKRGKTKKRFVTAVFAFPFPHLLLLLPRL